MPLTKISEELFKGLLAGKSYKLPLAERLKIIKEENPQIHEYLTGAFNSDGGNERDRTVWVLGATNMYMLLRSQAEADDLREQWE